jgi:hypothetical protein
MCSCQKKLDPEKMASFLLDADNGVYFRESNNGVDVSLMYQPAQLLAWKEARAITTSRDSIFNALTTHYKKYDYFLLGLSVNGKELTHSVNDMDSYADIRSKLSFHLDQCVLAMYGNDTLKMLDYQINNTYGAAPETQILLAIERDTITKKELKIQIANVFPNMKPVNAYFDRQKLNDIPNLDID